MTDFFLDKEGNSNEMIDRSWKNPRARRKSNPRLFWLLALCPPLSAGRFQLDYFLRVA